MRKVSVQRAKRCSILVVEDEFLIALSLQAVLEEAGFQVLGPAPSVKAALDLLERQRPNAAVLDINLRGQMVTPVARKLESLGVPFVMSSAYSGTDALLDDVLAGAPMLDKPVREQALIGAVAGIINSGLSRKGQRPRRKEPASLHQH